MIRGLFFEERSTGRSFRWGRSGLEPSAMKRRAPVVALLLLLFCSAVPLTLRTTGESGRILDPRNLTVAQLQAILDKRGIFGNYSEKREMVEQVERTGMAAREDLEEEFGGTVGAPEYFQGKEEFLPRVKHHSLEGTCWWIRILHSNNQNSSRDDEIWKSVEPKMYFVGFRVASLECCPSDSKLCLNWQEADTGVVLVVPNASGRLSTFLTPFPTSEAALHGWLTAQLAPIAETIDEEAMLTAWLPEPDVQVLFLTDSDAQPPLFFLVLSAHLPNFANSSIGSLPVPRSSTYIVLSPSRPLAFGSRPGQRLSFSSLEAFLLDVQFDLFDVLGVLYFIVGCLTCLDFLEDRRGLLHVAVTFLVKVVAFPLLASCHALAFMRFYRIAVRVNWCKPAALAAARLAKTLYAHLAVSDAAGLGRLAVDFWKARPATFGATFLGAGLLNLGAKRLAHRRRVDMRQYQRPTVRRPPNQMHLLVAMVDYMRSQGWAESAILQLVEPLMVNTREFEYIRDLSVWTWPWHAPGCLRPEAAEDGVCGCFEEAKDSCCAYIATTWASCPAGVLAPAGVDLDNARCLICQFDFSYKDTLCTLPCSHTFHRSGIQLWLLNQSHGHRCPTCRQPCLS